MTTDRKGIRPAIRAALGLGLLACGYAAQAALEHAMIAPRPPLSRPLSTLPMRLGDWVGRDEPVDPGVLAESQADDHINRVYEDSREPGRRVTLWINYSKHGLNLRHSPEVCLPGHGWAKDEARCQSPTIAIGDRSVPISQLAYKQGELVQGVGFWYYIFGEGAWERYVRNLPITSRSSHGRTTRGSGLTVEVFCPGESDPDGRAITDFAAELLPALEPLLPGDRAQYFIP